ncbi:MAG: DUF4249 domain-containing protein [Bacteroidota bacterium]
MRKFGWFLVFLLLQTCTDPVVPVFQPESGFYLVEGAIVNQRGLSQVRVTRSEFRDGRFLLLTQEGLSVASVNEEGQEVQWLRDSLDPQLYLPPLSFAAEEGKRYFLRITTADGLMMESEPEEILTPVSIDEVDMVFEQRSYFRSALSRWVPAFQFSIDFTDPAGQENYYQVKYRYWEETRVCASCERGLWRDGVCIPDDRNMATWDYECAATCYGIRFGDENAIISDQFGDGGTIANLPVARLDHVRETGGLLFEAQLFNISRSAHDFIRVLRELSEDGGGLNATIPTALNGNLATVGENSEVPTLVLGYVSAISVATKRLYFDRRDIEGSPLPNQATPVEEPPLVDCPPPIGCPPRAPCTESRDRTPNPPAGWGG